MLDSVLKMQLKIFARICKDDYENEQSSMRVKMKLVFDRCLTDSELLDVYVKSKNVDDYEIVMANGFILQELCKMKNVEI